MPTIDKRPLKVFLCHAHADRNPVRGLYARLTKDGVDAWLDKEKLLPGQDWELEIRKAVREADVVVVCLSKQFNQAGFRQKEVRLALDTAMEKPEGEIFIIPARLDECDNLESLKKWHWVDLFEDDGYEMLMRALRARADKIGATLQSKKSWLPIGNAQPAVVKKPSPPIEKPVEKQQEKSEPKKELQKPVTFNKTIIGIAGFIVLALVAIFGLRPLIGKPEPTPTATNLASLKTVTPIFVSKTPPPISTGISTTISLTSSPTDETFLGNYLCIVEVGSKPEFSVLGSILNSFQLAYDPYITYYRCTLLDIYMFSCRESEPLLKTIQGNPIVIVGYLIIIPAVGPEECRLGKGMWFQDERPITP
jgi:hypothetical protein